jgi:hypothetical protein
MDYKLKTTPDHKYCAVYSDNYLYCDFYEQLEPEDYTILKPEIIKRARAKYLFTLRRNSYYAHLDSHKFIIEFVTHPTLGAESLKETMILFNEEHGHLSVYNTKGQLVHKDDFNDKFISSIELINEKYMILHCWFWHPIYSDILYNIEELLSTPNYKGSVGIWSDWGDSCYQIIDNAKIRICYTNTNENDDDNTNKIDESKIIKEYTYELDYYYNNHKYIKQSFTDTRNNWDKDNLIKKILSGKTYDRTNIKIDSPEKIKLLSNLPSDQKLYIECIDNTDGDNREFVINRIIGLEDTDDLPKSITLARFYKLDDDRNVDISLIFHMENAKVTCKFFLKSLDGKYDPNGILEIHIF